MAQIRRNSRRSLPQASRPPLNLTEKSTCANLPLPYLYFCENCRNNEQSVLCRAKPNVPCDKPWGDFHSKMKIGQRSFERRRDLILSFIHLELQASPKEKNKQGEGTTEMLIEDDTPVAPDSQSVGLVSPVPQDVSQEIHRDLPTRVAPTDTERNNRSLLKSNGVILGGTIHSDDVTTLHVSTLHIFSIYFDIYYLFII